MANVYVRSGAAGAADGSTWANAFLTLAAALTAKAAGDDFWVSEDHAETQASVMTMTAPGTPASPNRIICVNHSGSVPPVSADLRTTATIATTGNFAMTLNAIAYVYGIALNCGSGAVAAVLSLELGAGYLKMENCALSKLGTTAAAGAIFINSATGQRACKVELINTTVQFGNTGDGMDVRGEFIWRDTVSAISGATIPTSLFRSSANSEGTSLLLRGLDLSGMGSNTIFASSGAAAVRVIRDCKIGASTVIAATPAGQANAKTDMIRCDSGATNYLHGRFAYEGTQTVETTIVRANGAKMGSQAFSWKLVTTANSKFYMPFEALPIEVWNLFAGQNVTVSFFGIAASIPNNDDLWWEAEYLGSGSTPIGSRATTTKADPLAAGSAYASDPSTWGGSTAPFVMTATLSSPQPGMVGAVRFLFKAAKASTTFYIDPKPVIQGVALGRQSLIGTSLVSEIPGRRRIGSLLAA